VDVLALRHAVARRRFGWRVVLFDDGDALEVDGEDARGDEAGHPGAQDDRPVSTGAEVSS
jgi:hypothetical protein